MGKIVKSNLGYLGEDFQYRLVAAFIDEPKFFKELSSIIDQNMFTEVYLRTIVGVMKDYYNEYDSVPSYNLIGTKLGEKIYTEEDRQYYDETLDKLREITTEGIEAIEDMAERFFKQQNLIKVANDIKRIAGDGDMARYDECRKLVEDALSVDRKADDMVTPLEDLNECLKKDEVDTIPTGVEKLDEVLGGGLDKGKLGVIIAGSGVGKTSMTTCFAANAAKLGYKIYHVVFEDSTRDIRRKYISHISQIETRYLSKDEETIAEAKRRVKESEYKDLIDNNIRIERFRVQKLTVEGLRSNIKKLINEGFKPDMVVVDYFGCLKLNMSKFKSKWDAEEDAIREFENLAPELDIAIWLPIQGNRESFTAETVEMSQVSGSITKVQVAQVAISITKSEEDAINQRAKIKVLKNRGGLATVSMDDLIFNNGTCTIVSDETVNW